MKKFLCAVVIALCFCCFSFGTISHASQVIDLETSMDVDTSPTVNPDFPIDSTEMPSPDEPVTEASTESTYNPLDDMFPDADTDIGEGLLPDVNPTDFFQRIYSKFNSGLVFWQRIAIFILIGFMVLNAIMVAVSWHGNRSNVIWYILGLGVCAVMCACVYYAPEIAALCTKWLVS